MNPETEVIYVEVDSIRARVLKEGAGPPLLLLHGWGCTAETMSGISRALKIHFTCYSVDFPGFGESSEPPFAWTIDDYTDFTIQLIKKLEIGGCPVIAHSFGGRVILKLLARPESKSLITKVLITGGAGMKPKRKPGYYIRKYTAMALKAPFMLLPEKLREKGLARLRSTSLWKRLGSSDYRTLDGTMRQVFINTVTEHLEPVLPKIEHEVFLLWGENDDATPLYQAKRMEKGLRNSALVTIPAAGHYAFLDQPGRFMAIAKAYLLG